MCIFFELLISTACIRAALSISQYLIGNFKINQQRNFTIIEESFAHYSFLLIIIIHKQALFGQILIWHSFFEYDLEKKSRKNCLNIALYKIKLNYDRRNQDNNNNNCRELALYSLQGIIV